MIIAKQQLPDDKLVDDAFSARHHRRHGNLDPLNSPKADNQAETAVPIRGMSVNLVQSTSSTKCAREGPGLNGSQKYCVSLATFPSLNSMMLTVYVGTPS